MLGGWTEEQALVFAAGYLFLDAINMTVFANNAWLLPIYINRGDLDYHLVRPISSLFFLSVRDFAANSFLNLIMAALLLVWALGRYSGPYGPGDVLLFVVLLFNGAILYHLLRLLTIIPVFWIQWGRGFEQLYWGLSRFMERPDRIFTGWMHRLLTTVLPFSIMASFPARLLLEGFSWPILLQISVVTAFVFVCVVFLWRRGLRAYSSASS